VGESSFSLFSRVSRCPGFGRDALSSSLCFFEAPKAVSPPDEFRSVLSFLLVMN